jgi:hypothetical protein
MKQSLLMLTVIGMMHFSADAQNKETPKSKFDINYKVCRIDNKKYTTCSETTPTVIYTPKYQQKIEKQEQEYQKTIDGLRKYDMYIHVHPLPPVEILAKRFLGEATPSFSGTEAAKRRLPMLENDGYAKINYRNLNYLNTSVELPTNDGGLSNHK